MYVAILTVLVIVGIWLAKKEVKSFYKDDRVVDLVAGKFIFKDVK